MFARRPGGGRMNRRGIGSAAPSSGIVTALDYVSASKVYQYVRADLGITLGTGVATWADQGSGGRDWTQATGAKQPTFSAAGGPNSQPMVSLVSASGHLMNATYQRPAPATENTGIWAVVRNTSDAAGDYMYSNGGRLAVYRRGAFNNFAIQSGVVAYGTGPASPAWHRVYVAFTGMSADIVDAGATETTGLNAGNAGPASAAAYLGSVSGAAAGDYDICEILITAGKLSAGERTALDAYVTSRYGAGLV